jgi:hypothetical protein
VPPGGRGPLAGFLQPSGPATGSTVRPIVLLAAGVRAIGARGLEHHSTDLAGPAESGAPSRLLVHGLILAEEIVDLILAAEHEGAPGTQELTEELPKICE